MKYLPALIFGLIALGCQTTPPMVDRAQRGFAEVKKGDAAYENGDLDGAIAHYEKALELVPEAPKFRFAYAQLLYWKGLSYSEASHRKWQKADFGRIFDDEINKWTKPGLNLSDKEKQELKNQSAGDRRQALVYFNKALNQLVRCDVEWNHAVESVPLAMGMVYIFMEEYDKAQEAFQRVLASSRVSEDYREKIEKVIKQIKQYKKELDLEREDEEDLLP